MIKLIVSGAVLVLGLIVLAFGVGLVMFSTPRRQEVRPLSQASQTAAQPVEPQRAPDPEPVRTGPVTLWESYDRNEVGADNSFRGRRIRVLAVATAIRKDALDKIVVELDASDRQQQYADERDPLHALAEAARGRVIQARFEDAWAEKVGSIERGDVLEVECTGLGLHMGIPILGDCQLDWAQPRNADIFAQVVGRSHELCLAEVLTPFVQTAIRDGALPDGGPVPDKFKQWASIEKKIREEDVRDLERLKQERLPCDHPAVTLAHACDGHTKESPQCDSKFMHLVMKSTHH